MRAADLVFAFPAIILAMVVTAALGPSVRNAVLALVVVSWPSYARVVRGLVLSVGRTEYVFAARLLGASARRTLIRDVLPNVVGPVLVLATLDLGNAVLLLSGLSFLGLGAQPPTPEWGASVAEGTQYFQYWWIGTFPGLAIFTVVLAFNFLGDSLRDALDRQSSVLARGDGDVSALLEVEGLTVTLPTDRGAGHDRRRGRLPRRAGPGLRRRGRVRQRQDDLDARADAAAAGGRQGGRPGAATAAATCSRCAGGSCARSVDARSRWSSRIRSRRSTRC